jgi:uncharacterized protein YwlG (UPF0340 family)
MSAAEADYSLPANLLDIPTLCSSSTELVDGPDELLARGDALEIAAEWNRESVEDSMTDKNFLWMPWHVVVERGETECRALLGIDVGETGIGIEDYTVSIPLRVVRPTTAELAPYAITLARVPSDAQGGVA